MQPFPRREEFTKQIDVAFGEKTSGIPLASKISCLIINNSEFAMKADSPPGDLGLPRGAACGRKEGEGDLS